MRSVQISEYDILICMNHMGLFSIFFYKSISVINLHEINAHICRQLPQIL